MNITNSRPPNKSGGLLAVLVLAAVLIALFWRSFAPDYVHFSNDNPLAVHMAAWMQLPAAFTSEWADLNDIGNNAGTYPLDVTAMLHWFLGPVGYAKFYPVAALLLLGWSAWYFFRQLKLTRLAAILGALAAMLNSCFFGSACWGVASQQIGIGMDFLALGLVLSDLGQASALVRWARWALAGMCVGINIMEGADIGAYFSLFLAAFLFFRSLVSEGGPWAIRAARGAARVAVVALFAAFFASQTIVALVTTQVQGMAGQESNQESKSEHWDWASQWSLPKLETLGIMVPGLFGYKMDTPNNMPEFEDLYQGGAYWGGMGRTPELDRYYDSGSNGPKPAGPGIMERFTGGQNYAGFMVLLIAAWAVAQSLRRKEHSVLTPLQRQSIWFWTVILGLSLAISWGRFDPFHLYEHTFYVLPVFSQSRNPVKLVLIFSWAICILFAYGADDLSRRFLNPAGVPATLGAWWKRVTAFDRKWTIGTLVFAGASLLAWLIYSSEKPGLMNYLHGRGFEDDRMAAQLADFSVNQAGLFALLAIVTIGLMILIIAGVFAGPRAKLGGVLLGALLLLDLGRADLPFVNHWNYVEKYEVGNLNPIVKFLAEKPYENRVKLLPFPPGEGMDLFNQVYNIEWVQQLFPFYNVQSLDIVQRPRVGSDIASYEAAFAPRSQETYYLLPRHWALTNTRLFVGATAVALGGGNVDTLSFLNGAFDPEQKRFRTLQRFDVLPKPGIEQVRQFSDLTIQLSDNGKYALFEDDGALPRVKLYSNWQVITNDSVALKTLTATNFDPFQTVVVAQPVPAPTAPAAAPGTVTFTSYHTKHIVLQADAATPAVLLLNDKYEPMWHVTVDGQPAALLRANYIMRGVYLPAGKHTVEFTFSLPNLPLDLTIAAGVLGLALCGFIFAAGRREEKT